ncbi:MAG: DEAD/DEAH box helicase, partial [Bacilli bacterium]
MSTTFSTFSLHPFLLEALKTEKITSPTQIQLDAIPVILKGKDVIGQSQTGTGKTFAYLLPTLHKLNADVKDLQAVVLAPTRELCMQIYQQINKLTSASELTAIALIGGADSKRQIEKLKTKPHIIVGTPGRILELNKLKKVKLHGVKTIVVDE